MNGVNVFIRVMEILYLLSALLQVSIYENSAVYNLEEGSEPNLCGTLISNFQPPELVK